MSTEIERKFLVHPRDWASMGAGTAYRQGYLSSTGNAIVRVRLAGEQGFLTIKGRTTGISREEFEYPIPAADANAMLAMCPPPLIDKTRYVIEHQGHTWEVDVFHGLNEGLTVAEIELASEHEPFERPDWLGDEVSHDPRYTNAALSKVPYTRWEHAAAGAHAPPSDAIT